MAKRKVNKSQAIRDYVISHPEATAKQVAAALVKKRIDVTTATVATVKSKAGLTKRRRKTATKKSTKRKSRGPLGKSSNGFVEVLIEAKRFHALAGSTEAALEAIHAIDRLESAT